MRFRDLCVGWLAPAALTLGLLCTSVTAQGPNPVARPQAVGTQPAAATPAGGPMAHMRPSLRPTLIAVPGEHPLAPILRWATREKKNIQAMRDYSAVLVKREMVKGKLGEYQYIYVRVRHQPFSVYLNFLGPASMKGREVIYIEGRNDGKILAHGTGIQAAFGTIALRPDSRLAMKDQRYPLPEIGMLNLVTRLVEAGQHDVKKGECEVKCFEGAEINKRSCTCIQVVHPVPRSDFLFHIARIFVDDELNLPVRYEAYSWPAEPGGKPVLMEEYTYLNIKINNRFDDMAFDVRNPDYNFSEKEARTERLRR